MKLTKLLASAAFVGTSMMLATPSSAATSVNVTMGIGEYGWTHDTTVYKDTAPTTNYSYYFGSFNITTGAGSFVAFCLDLLDSVGVPGTYDYEPYTMDNNMATATGAFSDNILGAARENMLQKYFNWNFDNLSSATDFAAFQIGLWEIVYEAVGTPYDISSGDFYAETSDSDDVMTTAQAFLNKLLSPDYAPSDLNGVYKLTFLDSDGVRQDLVYGQLVDENLAVPLPAAGLLLGSGVIGLFGFGRLKKARKAAV